MVFKVADGCNVRAAELDGSLRLMPEPSILMLVKENLGIEKLESSGAVQARVFGFVDPPMPPPPR